MAYRSCEHETTGLTPNMLMLGREVSTPLDIKFEMPHSIKSIPVHNWVWQLRERLESAHTYVRQNTGEAMKRQKMYMIGRCPMKLLNLEIKFMFISQLKRWDFPLNLHHFGKVLTQ